MPLLLLRHAFAGKRKHWSGDDRVRPLTPYGRQQAQRYPTMWADRPVELVVSSPSRRCMETVMPLVLQRAVSLSVADGLATSATGEQARAVLAELEGVDAVVCTHREVFERLLPAAQEDGARLTGGMKWPKGGAWELWLAEGRIVQGHRLPAPTGADPTAAQRRA